MKNNQKQARKFPNITVEQERIIIERKKRLGAALRENLNRRKMKKNKDEVSKVN
jgi:hypothetical protein